MHINYTIWNESELIIIFMCPSFIYFKDKYELVAWIFFHDTFKTNILSIVSAAKAMNDNITPAETIVEMMFHSMPENMKRIYGLSPARP